MSVGYDPTALDTIAMAEGIRQQDLSAVDLVDAHFARIETHNSQLRAVVTSNAEAARACAVEADRAVAEGEALGPLHGVPFTIKDAFETAGLRTTSSHQPLADYIPIRDAVVVARLKAAGAILLGKTNLPELANGIDCESPLHGRASNPWDLGRTPGGSCGGGAAAVAAHLTPFEIGSDAGGSIRIPAHFCGIAGFKSTDRLIPWAGHIPELPGSVRVFRQAVSTGPLARSVRDLELLTRVLAGPDPRDWEVPPVATEHVATPSLKSLRLRWSPRFGDQATDAATATVLETFVDTLRSNGAQVESGDPWSDGIEEVCLRGQGLFMLMFQSSQEPRPDDDIDSAHDLAVALSGRDEAITRSEAFLGGWDALLAPVAPGPAFRHQGTSGDPIPLDGEGVDYWSFTNFCFPYNLTGQPSVVLPVGLTEDGLPVGIQVIGKRWDDMRLLATAAALEPFTGGSRTPPMTWL